MVLAASSLDARPVGRALKGPWLCGPRASDLAKTREKSAKGGRRASSRKRAPDRRFRLRDTRLDQTDNRGDKPVELNREALASLGATCTDHRTPAAGLHADQKAVGPFTFRDRRLKSAFHHRSRQNKALDYIKKRLDLSTRLATSQQVIANTREFSVLDPSFASAGSATAQTRDASDRWAQFQPAKG